MTWLVAMLAAASAALWFPSRGAGQLARLRGAPRQKKGARTRLVSAAGCVALSAGVFVVAGPRAAGWAVTVLLGAGTVLVLGLRAGADRRTAVARREVARAARTMAGQLRIGQVPGVALQQAARDSPVLQSAAAASRIGGDVGGVLRACARSPGSSGLDAVAAAWDLSQRSGAPVADTVTRVADRLREDEAAQAAVAIEVAGARTTGRVMGVLPFAGVALGHLAGGDPVGFLTTHWVGEILAVLGVGLAVAGVWWLERLARRALA